MNYLLQDLFWLIEPPDDFRKQIRELKQSSNNITSQIRSLANTRLDTNQLTSLSSLIKEAQKKRLDFSNFSEFRIGIVGQVTTNLFSAALPAAAARFGISLSIVEAEYGQLMQEAIDPSSKINLNELDAILICLDARCLPFHNNSEENASVEFIKTIRSNFARHTQAPVIFHTLSCIPEPEFGSYDRVHTSTIRKKIELFNSRLFELAQENGDYVLDIATLAECIGTNIWHDSAQWNLYKLPFSARMIPIYVDHVARLLSAIRGLSKKCLVLDLDNTLWGGVIGDDGLEGIRLGQGDPVGEAHLNVQKMAMVLKNRGIVLAVCSKNDYANAILPFQKHPDMILKEEHFACFLANWSDKATNLIQIANSLNIGIDSLVFVDDNPVERELVRQMLPKVAVPELSEDASYYVRTVLNAGYFEAVNISQEDFYRTDQYRANAQREALASSIRDIDSFLESLDMRIDVREFDELNMPRISQLINKTNQFNLTTRRYTHAEIAQFSKDPNSITLQARLSDKFGDNGIISVIIVNLIDDNCYIDTWLMSCRVLGRKVEQRLFQHLVDLTSQRGCQILIGEYIKSDKNELVADHYEKLGFHFMDATESSTRWGYKIDDYEYEQLPFNQV